MKRDIVVIAHNLRSTHNVGSLLRTAEGLGVRQVILSGYTPYPRLPGDKRLPWLADKLHRQIHKTALGAEDTLSWNYHADITKVLHYLVRRRYVIAALEQHKQSVKLPDFWPLPPKIALIIGNEAKGMEPEVWDEADFIVEIPMRGKKESFNVIQATAMALYHLTFHR